MISSTEAKPVGAPPRRVARLLSAALVLSLGLATSQASAQPGGARGGPGGPFGLSAVSATYSFSSDGDLERNGTRGSAEISHYGFAAAVSLPAPATWRLSAELSWSRDELELTGAVPLPDELESIGLNVTATKDLANHLGPGWSALAILGPSFSSDSGEFSGDSFSLLAIAAIGREVSPTFSWSFGVLGRTRGENKVLPMIGIRWAFAPDWRLDVGFPRTGVSYQVNEALRLNTGLSFHGGTYYIADAPAPGLGDTYLDYQELRFGVGAEYQVSRNLSLVVDGGAVLDRSFDYDERGFELDGASAGYGRFSLRYRF